MASLEDDQHKKTKPEPDRQPISPKGGGQFEQLCNAMHAMSDAQQVSPHRGRGRRRGHAPAGDSVRRPLGPQQTGTTRTNHTGVGKRAEHGAPHQKASVSVNLGRGLEGGG